MIFRRCLLVALVVNAVADTTKPSHLLLRSKTNNRKDKNALDESAVGVDISVIDAIDAKRRRRTQELTLKECIAEYGAQCNKICNAEASTVPTDYFTCLKTECYDDLSNGQQIQLNKLLTDAAAADGEITPSKKVMICHLDGGDVGNVFNNTYVQQEIPEARVATHLGHGDGYPGKDIPGYEGFTFQDDCTPINISAPPSVSSMPSGTPSTHPSSEPSEAPSNLPSSMPSIEPSLSSMPSDMPSSPPSVSGMPSSMPSANPSSEPSKAPSDVPSSMPSNTPSLSSMPSLRPSAYPSLLPTPESEKPSTVPSLSPSLAPSKSPMPSSKPSRSAVPSTMPSVSAAPTKVVIPDHHFYDLIDSYICNTDSNGNPMPYVDFGLFALYGDIADWDVSQVTNMAHAFSLNRYDWANYNNGCTDYSQAVDFDLSSWDTSSVVSMRGMFKDASSFNADISNWNVGKVRFMDYMFAGASSFNSDISSWDIEAVIDWKHMFDGASAFSRNLCGWGPIMLSYDHLGYDNVEEMFSATSCPDSDIPEVWDDPISPLCHVCS